MVTRAGRRQLDRAGAVAALAAGEVVALPTDTVYGLAVKAGVPGASEAIFALKLRPEHVALAVLVTDLKQASPLVAPEDLAALAAVAGTFWPGPLTAVVRRGETAELELGGDPATIGLRCPDHALVRTLCRQVGPLIVTSANRHGGAPCTTADEVHDSLGDDVAVVDGGRCAGAPSTVIDLTAVRPRLLRAGPVALEDVWAVLDS